MKAIVTGASGFIGSRLVAELIASGYEVAAIGRKCFDKLQTLRKQLLCGSFYIQSDLDCIDKLEQKLLLAGFHGSELSSVFHLAWGGKRQLSDLDVSAQISNIVYTTETFEMAARLQANSYVFCGSMEEAFAEAYTSLDYANERKYNRHVVYALAKISAREALKLKSSRNLPAILFATNSHVMGPGDDKDSFLQVALSKIIAGRDIEMSSGEQRFDVINVADCARAYIAIAEKGISGASYWVGSGDSRLLRDYVEEMNALFPRVDILYGSIPFNDVVLDRDVFSISKTRFDTGFEPQITFATSVRELAEYLENDNNSDPQ